MATPKLKVALVGASLARERELPGFEDVRDYGSESFNLAIGSLKAAALADPDLAGRVGIDLIDLSLRSGRRELVAQGVEAVLASGPDVVGLSCYCWSLELLLELGARVAAARPRALVIAGGPSAGPVAEELLAGHPFLGAVALGEGEVTLTALLRAVVGHEDLSGVPGLCLRGPDGATRRTDEAGAEVDLETLPSPYRSGVLSVSSSSMLLETSRGCRFRCRFCSWASGPRRLRHVPISSLEADLRWALEHGVTDVKLTDSALNADAERLRQLSHAVARVDPDRRLRFRYFVKAELLSDEQVELLRGIPSAEIIVGVESLEDDVRRAAGKTPIDSGAFESRLGRLAEAGPVTLSLILGLPSDSLAGLARALAWAVELDRRHPGWLHEVCLFWLAVLPGSPLHRERHARGFRVAPSGLPYLLESGEHGPDDLLAMARLAAEVHFAHPKVRVDHFIREYLAADGPIDSARRPPPRRARDDRAVVLVVAAGPEAAPGPASLEAAQVKAFAEKHADLRQAFRIELAALLCRAGKPTSESLERLTDHCRALSPELVVVVASGVRSLGPELCAALRAAAPRARLVLAGVADDVARAAELLATCEADAAVAGEAERPVAELLRRGGRPEGVPGLAWRAGGSVHRGPRAEPVATLDEVPSPFQWGMVSSEATVVGMRLSRPGLPGARSRAHSFERIFGDVRWSVEGRCRRIVWLDRPLPADRPLLAGWVDAIARADRDRTLVHDLAVDEHALRSGAAEPLASLRAGRIVVPPGLGDHERALTLAARTGGVLVEDGTPELPRRLAALFRPWQRRGRLEGWAVTGVEAAGDGSARIGFEHEGGGRALAEVASARPGLAPELRPGDPAPPPGDLGRLASLVDRWLAKGEPFLRGERR